MKLAQRTFARIVIPAAFLAVLLIPHRAAADLPARPPDGSGVFLIVFQQAYAATTTPEALDVTKFGGTEHERRGDVWVVTLPLMAWATVEAHPDVAYVQRVWMGEPLEHWSEGRQPKRRLQAATHGATETDALDAAGAWDSGVYSYDGSGNVVAIGSDQFSYDSAGRIIAASVEGLAEQYAYDSFGNLVAKKTGDRVARIPPVDPNSNRFVGYPYDVSGSVMSLPGSGGSWERASGYEYDSMGMPVLVSSHTGGAAQRMIYTADDERIAAIDQGDRKYSKIWIRGFGNEVLREYRGTFTGSGWTWIQDYVWAGGKIIAAEREQANGGQLHFHLDHLGSTRLITKQDRTRLSAHTFFPFGAERTDSTYELRNFNITPYRIEPMKFTGHERDFNGPLNVDGLDHLDYMHARYYDASLGRFLSVDPGRDWDMSRPQSWNLYAYVRNNPVNATDPTGRQQVTKDQKQSSGPTDADVEAIKKKERELFMEDLQSAEIVITVTYGLATGTATFKLTTGGNAKHEYELDALGLKGTTTFPNGVFGPEATAHMVANTKLAPNFTSAGMQKASQGLMWTGLAATLKTFSLPPMAVVHVNMTTKAQEFRLAHPKVFPTDKHPCPGGAKFC